MGMDDKVIPMISSCNIACGYHASDPMVMQKTVAMAKEAGIGIGAHPGYPDLMGFGRRNMNVSPKEAAAYVTYQLGALYAFAKAAGVKLQHVKPHGALYKQGAKASSPLRTSVSLWQERCLRTERTCPTEALCPEAGKAP